ncbi:MAG: HDOD domain-containing protein [Halieaceae bacterium]|jgi:HD-like signal output (HDOD) protein|nr:HDOD domain-containing protein [Halieaceae bacterium]
MEVVDSIMRGLRPEALPVFNKTVQDVLNVTRSETSAATELVRVILSDPNMTAHVLHVANRIPYNPSVNAIATVSQAVLLLGFETISRLSLTKAFIDSLLKGSAQQYLLDLVSQSLHAAVQAHALALVRKDESPEDVFVATLLKRIGDIALWSLSPERSQRVAELMDGEHMTMPAAQREVFGCSGAELTERLSTEWSLGTLLGESLDPRTSKDVRVHCIDAGEAIAASAATGDQGAIEAQLESLQELLKIDSESRIQELISESTTFAADMAKHFGLPTAPICDLGPEDDEPDASDDEGDSPAIQWIKPDPSVQLSILGEILQLLERKPDVNVLLEMVAEGIYRGAGMDTVFFAMMTPERTTLRVRVVLTQDPRALPVRQKILMESGHCVAECIRGQEAFWHPGNSRGTPDGVLEKQSRSRGFLIQSVRVGKVPIGIFYADRAASGRDLDEEAFSAFRQFCQQANLGLSFLKKR